MVDSNTLIDLSQETDQDLIEIFISFREDDKNLSDKAYTLFLNRFQTMIWKTCVSICRGQIDGENLAGDLYCETITNIYICSRFSIDNEKDPKIIKKRIQGWLIRIIENTFKKLITKDFKPFNNEDYEIFNKMYQSSKQPSIPSINEKIVNQALDLLSARDKDIVLTYWRFYEKGNGSQSKNLPPEILKGLEQRHNTTTVNIHQIISRGNKKIKEFLLANSQFQKR